MPRVENPDWNYQTLQPTKFTEVLRMKYLELLAQGVGRTVAAHTVGVHPKTVIRYYKGHPEFKDDIEMAERRVVDKAEKALIEIALVEKDFHALKFLLERLDRQKWGDRKQVDVTVDGKVEHLLELAPADAIERIEAEIAERHRALEEGGELYEDDEIIDAEIVEPGSEDAGETLGTDGPTRPAFRPSEPPGLPTPWETNNKEQA